MSNFNSAIVTLNQANLTIRPDGELWGALVVQRRDGVIRTFGQYLPCADVPEPPGWSTVTDLTGVRAADVITAWNAYGTRNTLAEQAFEHLREHHVGREFLARELTGVHGFSAVELLPINLDDPAVTVALDEAAEAAADTTAVIQWVSATQVTGDVDPNGDNPPTITIHTDYAPPCTIQVPDDDFGPEPSNWWTLEILTEIDGQQLGRSWRMNADTGVKESAFFTQVRDRLVQLLAKHRLPIRDGVIDLELFRRTTILNRYNQGHVPALFVGRPLRLLVKRAWTLMKDTAGPQLYRYNVERGANSGLPAFIRRVGGQAKLEILDNDDKMRGAVSICMDFVRVRRTHVHVNPPQFVIKQMMTFADQTVPPIDTLVRIPTMRPDGSIHDQEGYDPRSRIWYAPEMHIEPIPENPSDKDIRDAITSITTPFSEFPFVEDSGSRVAVLACLLEQVIRPMIYGPRPIYAFDAPAYRGQGTGKCAESLTLSLSSRGLIPIKDLCSAQLQPDESIGYASYAPDETPIVPTHTGKHIAAEQFYNGGIKPCLRARTRRGYTLSGTHVHPVRVASAEPDDFRELRNLRPGDYVALTVQRHPGAGEDRLDEDCAYLLGALTADGDLNERAYKSAPTYTKSNAALRERVCDLAYEHLAPDSVVPTGVDDAHTAPGLRFNGDNVRARMRSLGLSQTTAPYKRIPWTVMQSSSRVWASFLRGLFDGDACIDKQGFEWTTASEQLGHEVQVMLAALGVWCARKPKEVQLEDWDEPRTYWRITFSGADLDAYAEAVGFSDAAAEKRDRLLARVRNARKRNTNLDVVPNAGPLIRRIYDLRKRTEIERNAWKREMAGKNSPARIRLRAWLDSHSKEELAKAGGAADTLYAMCADHVRWDRVEEVEDIGERQVYDLCVPDDHSFVGNAIQQHNTLLPKAIGAVILGRPPALTTWPEDPKELPKVITAKLLAAESFVIFDNLEGTVRHKDLAALATSEYWSNRLLHTNETPKLPQTATWALTLNGARFNRDLARRTILVKLDTRMEDPELRRGFRIKKLVPWCLQRRASIIRSCLVLARAWVCAGRPEDPRLVMGSFEGWCEVVGGILYHAGFAELPLAIKESRARDMDTDEHERFVSQWAARMPNVPVTALHLANLAESCGLYGAVLEGKAANWKGRHMAGILRKLVGHRFDAWKVEVLGERGGQAVYAVRALEARPSVSLPSLSA